MTNIQVGLTISIYLRPRIQLVLSQWAVSGRYVYVSTALASASAASERYRTRINNSGRAEQHVLINKR